MDTSILKRAMPACVAVMGPMAAISSAGGLLYDYQTRSISASASAYDFITGTSDYYHDEMSTDPGDFGGFNEYVGGSVNPGDQFAGADSSQNSSFAPLLVTAAGSASAGAFSIYPPEDYASAHADSYLAVEFHVTSATPIRLNAFVDGGWGGPQSVTLALAEDGALIDQILISEFNVIEKEYSLEPGHSYYFEVDASAGAVDAADSWIEYNLTLEVIPEPASLLLVLGGLPLLLRRRR